MAHLFVLLFVALPLLRLLLAIAWPGVLKHLEGRRAERMLTKQFGAPIHSPRIEAISSRLLHGADLHARFSLLPGPIKNAIALPNGRIFIWEGLLAETAGDEDMLAGVLAHELGHLEHDHYLTQMQWRALASFVLGIIGGSLLRQLLQKAATHIVTRGFSRAQELEADETALTLMAAAGYDPAGMVRLLEQLASETPASGLLGTHPEPHTRANRIRARLGMEAPRGKPAPPPPPQGGTVIQFPGRK